MAVSSVILILLFSLPPLWAKGPAANRKGGEAYRRGDYERAVQAYRRAGEALPGDRTVAYNQGTALLGQEKYEEALKSLMAGAGDPRRDVKSAALYNAGNALAASDKLPEALSAYRQAILADPGDMDAKFNYELAKRKLEQEQGQGGDDENQDESRDQNQEQNRQGEDENEEREESRDPRDQEQQDQEEERQDTGESEDQAQQNPDRPQPEPGEEQEGGEEERTPQPVSRLTPQQAERLLDALKDNEMEMIKARLKSKRKKNVEKDW